jgi:hypothetical protein
VSAADTSASAIEGRGVKWSGAAVAAGARVATGAASRSRRPSAASVASAATGACARKIASHENASVSAPPSAGPIAVDSTAAPSHSRRAPRVSSTCPTRRTNAATRPAAPPAACPPRATSSTTSEPASPHASEASAKTPNPIAPTRAAPCARTNRSAGISAAARMIV